MSAHQISLAVAFTCALLVALVAALLADHRLGVLERVIADHEQRLMKLERAGAADGGQPHALLNARAAAQPERHRAVVAHVVRAILIDRGLLDEPEIGRLDRRDDPRIARPEDDRVRKMLALGPRKALFGADPSTTTA
jgi:hypothetical protein